MRINTIKPLKQRNMFSRDFNITTKETFGIPISRDTKCPFYFFNPDSGYYWVEPFPALEKKMPNDVFFIYKYYLSERKSKHGCFRLSIYKLCIFSTDWMGH